MTNSPIILPGIVFAGVLAVVMGIMALTSRRGAAGRRLQDHAVPVVDNDSQRLERVHVLREHHYSTIGVVDAILRRFKLARTAADELMRANAWLTVSQYLLLRCVVASFLFVAVKTLTGITLLAIPAIVVGLILPRIALRLQARRRRIAFEGQLAETLDLIVGALRAGYGFLQAMEAVTKEVADPMREEFMRVIEQVNVGTAPADALQELPRRIASYDLSLFVTAVTVQRTIGGNLAEVLENIAETVRERRRIRAEVRAITTGPRVSSYVVGVIPLAVLVILVAMDSDYRQVMLYETIGRLMIGFAAVWSLIGLATSTAVSKVEY
jgi:tight adherence protein B